MEEAVGGGLGIVIAILMWIVVGLVIGFVARMILPGEQRIGFWLTAGCGIGGAFIAGLLGRLIAEPLWLQIVLSIAGAMLLIFIVNKAKS